MPTLPKSIFDAQRQAPPNAVLRVVPYAESPDTLPATPDVFSGPATSTGKVVLRFVATAAISVAAVMIITLNAWDDDGFFPWFWNPLWALFPWVFLGPLWAAFIRSVRRRPAADRFRAAYGAWRKTAVGVEGRVTDVRMSRTDDGGTAAFVMAVSTAIGEVVVGRIAPGAAFAAHEAPQPGDTVHVWRGPDDWTIVQAARGRQSSTTGTPPPSLAVELGRLAALHDSGGLDDAEYEQAKRRLLDS